MRKISTAAAIFAFCVSSATAQTSTTTVTIAQTACSVLAPEAATPPATPSVAGGIEAARNKNYALALANFRPLADSGDAKAQTALAQLLMQNCTGLQDKTQAATWLVKAADTGDVVAETQLARAYMNGLGVAQDDAKAFALFTKAAQAGNATAEMDLGYFYLSGRAGTADPYQAMVWSVKSGEQGEPTALANIASAYFHGKALPQDTGKAAYYIFTAIERSTPAQRAQFVDTSNNIVRQMSQDDVKDASKRAQRWSPGSGSLSEVLKDAARRRDQHG